MRSLSPIFLFGMLAHVVPAGATTVFTENFNSETGGLNSSLTQFAIAGSVDTVTSANSYDISVAGPASGNVIDMNGTGAAGRIISLASFKFAAGDIIALTFDLGGSQRGGIGDLFSTSFLFEGNTAFSGLTGTGLFSALDGSGITTDLTNSVFVGGATPFTTSSISFLADTAGSLRFAFGSPSDDDIGPLLDNVSLNVSPQFSATAAPVPEPATWSMMLAGFALTGFALRRSGRHRRDVRFYRLT